MGQQFPHDAIVIQVIVLTSHFLDLDLSDHEVVLSLGWNEHILKLDAPKKFSWILLFH